MNIKSIFGYFLFLIIISVSCTGIDPLGDADQVNYEAEFAFPLFDSKISIANLVESVSENTAVRVEQDGSVTVLFNGDLIRKGADQVIPIIPGLGDVQLFDTVAQIPFIFDQVILRRALIKGDAIHFRFRNDLPEDITVRVWIPQVTRDGEVFEQEFTIPYEGELPSHLTTENVSLAGWELVSDDNTITYYYDARLPNGERIVLDKAWANVNFLIFTYVEGFFGRSPFDIEGDIITIGIFEKWVDGTLEFDDPKVTVRVDNAFGFPVRSQTNTLNITTISGQVLDIEAEAIDQGIDYNYPALDEVGEVKSTFFELTKDNSNIREIFNEKAARLTYDIDALANPENDPTDIGFATDSSYFLINLAIELPMKGKADNFTIVDTVVSKLEVQEEYNEAEFKLISRNYFPVDMSIQLEFLSESGELLDVMFEDPFLLEAASLLPDGTTEALPEETTFVLYDKERVDLIRQAKKVVLKSSMTSYEGANESITILDEFTLDVRMGLKLKIVD